MTRKRIDRDDELTQLHNIREGKTKERIFLISAGGGVGKSALLREFIAEHPQSALLASIEFKDSGISLTQLICSLCDSFDWEYFPTLSQVIKEFISKSSINVSGNIFAGQNRLDAAVHGLDDQTRELRYQELTKAFFKDVRAMKQATIVLDVFEKCDLSVKQWIVNSFLLNAHRSSNLTVVIAGREVPEPSLQWSHIHLPLRGIENKHWHDHARSIGLTIEAKLIDNCCASCNGSPLAMLQVFRMLQGQAE